MHSVARGTGELEARRFDHLRGERVIGAGRYQRFAAGEKFSESFSHKFHLKHILLQG
ncbi:hypothetical protein SDC9_193211 [bioreactor metagenome]|uniref:Uncharacterized protein n=1 Tax=bioreactor metagenome TaxID=1076179 RepID=A0A645I4F2_9ZZZZ